MRIILVGSKQFLLPAEDFFVEILDQLEVPTLLINPVIAKHNIARMADKARSQGVQLRPHFKTHQSAQAGEWFREVGVNSITTSSVEMADYFSRHAWQDILIAFPVNVRQMRSINELAVRCHLGLLVESIESVNALATSLVAPVDLWIKIDSGSGRTGLVWDQVESVANLIRSIRAQAGFQLRGLLTHAGYTYSAVSRNGIVERYQTSVSRMNTLRAALEASGTGKLEISVGDTPGCTLAPSLGAVDEIRPGNFVYYDAQMIHLGVCTPLQVAGVMACPVVALHPEREEAVVYGGAVHLSKDTVVDEGLTHYGYVVRLNTNGEWSLPIQNAYAARLSQEHGILHIPLAEFNTLKVGDWLGILPAHICLTVAAMQETRLLDGTRITSYRSAAPA